jgi:hypothetical protein
MHRFAGVARGDYRAASPVRQTLFFLELSGELHYV